MENTLRIIKQIERTHRNLGLPVVFAKLIDLSNMGEFISGHRSTGKGATLNSVKLLRHRDVMEITRITPAGLAKEAKNMSNRSITIINPDFSSFYTRYLKDAGINLVSYLLTEHGVPKSWTAKYSYDVTDCYISFLTSTQPSMLRRINALPAWESMYRDRFIRFHMLYPFGTPKYIEQYPTVPTLTFELKNPETDVAIPRSVRRIKEYIRLKAVLQRQTSEGRSGIYLNRLLKAHAFINNRDTVANKDVKFLSIFLPYLIIDYLLSQRQAVSAALKFNPDAYLVFFYLIEHEEATRRKLKRYFMLIKQKGRGTALTRAINPLLAANLVEGVYGTPTYRVNRKWHKQYITPLKEWSREMGIKMRITEETEELAKWLEKSNSSA